MSDTKTFFSKNFGWSAGERNGRWVMVIEKDGTISVADAESKPGKVTVSSENECSVSIRKLIQCPGLGCRCRVEQVVKGGRCRHSFGLGEKYTGLLPFLPSLERSRSSMSACVAGKKRP